MYAALWRLLPGPTWLKILQIGVLAVIVFFVLMEIIFPQIGPLLPWADVNVSDS